MENKNEADVDANPFKSWFKLKKSNSTFEPDFNYSVLDDEVYNFGNKSMGKALIFNQIRFDEVNEYLKLGLIDRAGSEKDAEDFKEVLTRYGFKSQVFTDLSVAKIKFELQKGKNNSSFVE